MKTTSTIYNKTFWNAVRGNNAFSEIKEGSDKSGGYVIPSDFNDKYLIALEKENVFRRLATVVDTTSSEGKIHAVTSTGAAEWIRDAVAIPESADTFKRFTVNSHKLASIAKIKTKFIEDNNFNLEAYLEKQFSRRFGRSEENAFINGNGIDEPTGILNSADGGEIGLTVEDATTLSYDHIIKLYFSLDKEHRRNAVWLINDETALTLRTLKDSNGNYLWNQIDNTILGKTVEYSTYMPKIEAGAAPIAFGDFSYYWIIQRQPLTLKVLKELYILDGEIGITGYERLDGKLILQEAVKLLKIA